MAPSLIRFVAAKFALALCAVLSACGQPAAINGPAEVYTRVKGWSATVAVDEAIVCASLFTPSRTFRGSTLSISKAWWQFH